MRRGFFCDSERGTRALGARPYFSVNPARRSRTNPAFNNSKNKKYRF